MNKTAVALALVVCIAAVATVVVYVVKSRQPAQGDEFSSVENQLNELDNFLGFEDQMFDYDLSQIAGDWG